MIRSHALVSVAATVLTRWYLNASNCSSISCFELSISIAPLVHLSIFAAIRHSTSPVPIFHLKTIMALLESERSGFHTQDEPHPSDIAPSGVSSEDRVQTLEFL